MNIAKACNDFVDKLSASIGGGGVRLTLQTHAAAPKDGEIVGMLLVQGGIVAQHIEKVVVELKELHQQGESAEYKTLSGAMVAAHINIAPGQMQEYAFRLPVPAGARLSASASSAQVAAVARVRGGVKRCAHVYVKVTPCAEIMALDTALQQLGFRPKQYNFISMRSAFCGATPYSHVVTKSYHAPSALASQITGATLQLRLETTSVAGHLILNHARTNLKDVVRAALGEDSQGFPLTVSRYALTGKGGTGEAKTLLKNLLNQALILPDNQANWMLRAASPPLEAGETLLRAAEATSETHPNELLRPSDQKELPSMSSNNVII